MRSRKCIFAFAGLAAAGTLALIAQENEQPTFRLPVNVVLAPTTVLDKDGNYVVGIKGSEFRLFDNSKLQNIKVDEIFAPISLVVAIQADAKAENALPRVQKIGTMLQSMIAGDQGEVAVVAFDHRIQKLQDFTADPDKIQEALKKIKPGSSTSVLTDTVVEATRML